MLTKRCKSARCENGAGESLRKFRLSAVYFRGLESDPSASKRTITPRRPRGLVSSEDFRVLLFVPKCGVVAVRHAPAQPKFFDFKSDHCRQIAAPPLFSSELHLATAGRHYSEGAHTEGWIAIGRDDSRVFGMAASNQSLLGPHKTVRSISLLLKPEFTEKNRHCLQRPP